MSRYIDADALKRKAQKVGTEAWKMKMTAPIETTLNQFIDWIDNAPSIDIVRCKECKHYKMLEAVYDCEMGLTNVAIKDFCSYGVKKGADDETEMS